MLIKRIRATNFKTYLDLDLDLSVASADRPIILVGGANGGGKTTLFEAIYGALYGLSVSSAGRFRELLNAGQAQPKDAKMTLEIQFSGQVLSQTQQYVLTRTYALNTEQKPVESVRLNLDGTLFQYGTATPPTQRAEQQRQVDKIIKANLPRELSRYFLFDAMEAGNLLKEDQLNRVIRENIENVMGFDKYLRLARAAETVTQEWTAQRLRVEREKQEYLKLIGQKRDLEEALQRLSDRHTEALQYAVQNKDLYDGLKAGMNQETAIKGRIDELQKGEQAILEREAAYLTQADTLAKNLEAHVGLPHLADTLRAEVTLLLSAYAEASSSAAELSPEQVGRVVRLLVDRLVQSRSLTDSVDISALTAALLADLARSEPVRPDAFLDPAERRALEDLVKTAYVNPFVGLAAQQTDLTLALAQLPKLRAQTEELKAQVAGKDYTLLRSYEANEVTIRQLEGDKKQLEDELRQVEKKIVQFDIQMQDEPDPRYETLKRLKPFFEETANGLLRAKKREIEERMRTDLNKNLVAYRDVIERVELSEDLRDLTFRLYHMAGNEIYLSQLNTASKQVVIQVLLKALHEFGDYDPPVMIDTVMGVFGSETREAIVENYFPDLSSQTILLSSDEEIRLDKEYVALEPFISKTYTLVRDRFAQQTRVEEGYFRQRLTV
jgi:DNA sulfur modification protein DndD